MACIDSKVIGFVSLLVVQIVFLILFWIFVRYEKEGPSSENHETNSTSNLQEDQLTEGKTKKYPSFQDVHVMIFVGIAFLITFLRKYGYSATGFTLLLGAVIVQWAILVEGFFRMEYGYISVSLVNIIEADFAAATPLISMGVILGRTSPLQLLFLVLLEIPIFAANLFIQTYILSVADVGGSFTVHAFGAYFGLGVSMMMRQTKGQNDPGNCEGSTYRSDIFSMIGTLFLWVYWPSFNSVLAVGEVAQERAIINTYLSLAAATVTTFAISALVTKDNKFSMSHVQNSTLAGGVAVGAVCNLLIGSHGAVLLGMICGAVSVLGYQFLTPAITMKFRIHDTCGVHNLHGLPAVVSAVASAIYACLVTQDAYKTSMVDIYPAMADVAEMSGNSTQILGGYGRSAMEQGSYQLLGIVVTVLLSLSGGLFGGFLLKIFGFGKLYKEQHHLDEIYWEVARQDRDEHY